MEREVRWEGSLLTEEESARLGQKVLVKVQTRARQTSGRVGVQPMGQTGPLREQEIQPLSRPQEGEDTPVARDPQRRASLTPQVVVEERAALGGLARDQSLETEDPALR